MSCTSSTVYDGAVSTGSSSTDSQTYTKLVDTEGQYKYIGEAVPGSSEASSVWRIKRVEFLTGANSSDIEIKWANGSALFDRAWTNRASETYS